MDGYIARRYNQKSELGAILDPLADKLLLVSAIVTLSFNHSPHLGQIPLWLTGTIIGRDLLILIGIVVIRLTVGKVKVRPRFVGKIATVFQMIVVVWILLDWDRDLNARWLKVWTHWRRGVYRHLRIALRFGRHETARRPSGQFGGNKTTDYTENTDKIFSSVSICVICG